jgi:magnesium transporter
MGATAVVASFERSLEETVAIAFFVPGIVYLADAIGTQTEAVAVRGLSLGPVAVRRLLAAELTAGLLIGLALGLVALASVTIAFDDGRLALAVGIAIFVAGGLSTTIGLLFPLMLDRLGSDPAFGSGPVATIVQDVLSLLAYFVTAELLV